MELLSTLAEHHDDHILRLNTYQDGLCAPVIRSQLIGQQVVDFNLVERLGHEHHDKLHGLDDELPPHERERLRVHHLPTLPSRDCPTPLILFSDGRPGDNHFQLSTGRLTPPIPVSAELGPIHACLPDRPSAPLRYCNRCDSDSR